MFSRTGMLIFFGIIMVLCLFVIKRTNNKKINISDEEKQKWWDKFSSQGKKRYLLKHTLSSGVSGMIGFIIFAMVLKKNSSLPDYFFIRLIIIFTIVSFAGGYFSAMQLWGWVEKKTKIEKK
ncbi:MAG: hypothetical protein WC614_02370 [bacterium]